MKVVNISRKKLDTLDKIYIPSEVTNTESQIYMYKNEDNKQKSLFKKLYIDQGEIFSNKLYTVNELIERKDDFDIEELVFPESIISVGGKISGFLIPYIENINLQTMLISNKYTFEEKISRLKEIGDILERLKDLRQYTEIKGFYINDLNASNFIINNKTNKLNVVDLDSCKIGNNLAQPSKLLASSKVIGNVSKYKKNKNNIGGNYVINENTDLFCYVATIIEFLSQVKMSSLSKNNFDNYLEYLKSLGVSLKLLDKLSLIYEKGNNENPSYYLDYLNDVDGKSDLFSYQNMKRIRN